MAVSDYSTTPDENVTISGINIAEGCAPSGINNAIRQMMADIKTEAADKASSISTVAADLATEVARAQAAEDTFVPLAGGTMTGSLTAPSGTIGVAEMKTDGLVINQGTNTEGAQINLKESTAEDVVIDRYNNLLRIFGSNTNKMLLFDPATGILQCPQGITGDLTGNASTATKASTADTATYSASSQYLRTFNKDNVSHGESFMAYCKYMGYSDGKFRFVVPDRETSVDCAYETPNFFVTRASSGFTVPSGGTWRVFSVCDGVLTNVAADVAGGTTLGWTFGTYGYTAVGLRIA